VPGVHAIWQETFLRLLVIAKPKERWRTQPPLFRPLMEDHLGDEARREPGHPSDAPIDEQVHTAIVMPICNENVQRVFAGLRATYDSLARTGERRHFGFFVLSDSSDPDLRVAARLEKAGACSTGSTQRSCGGCCRWSARDLMPSVASTSPPVDRLLDILRLGGLSQGTGRTPYRLPRPDPSPLRAARQILPMRRRMSKINRTSPRPPLG
jgi:hypothetical protein